MLNIEPYFYLLLTVVIVLSLVIIYKNYSADEDLLIFKLIGYFFLGGFAFAINKFPIPIGFAAYLLFFRPKINVNAKKMVAYLGLTSLLLAFAIPGVARTFYEAPRKVEASSPNILANDLFRDWETIHYKFNIPENAKLENFRSEFSKDGKIIRLSYNVVAGYPGSFIIYWVDFLPSKQVYNIQARKVEQWTQYESLIIANKYFELLEQLSVEKILPHQEYSTYGLACDGRYERYETKSCHNYLVVDNELIELDIEQLPVKGYCISTYGYSMVYRQDAERSYDNSRSHCYFFDLIVE